MRYWTFPNRTVADVLREIKFREWLKNIKAKPDPESTDGDGLGHA